MKHTLLLAAFACLALPLASQTSCEIAEIYEGSSVKSGVKVLTADEEIEDLDDVVELILEESSLEAGVYEITVSRKGDNLYEVQGTSLYLETRYCYEYNYSDQVILNIESQYGFTKGSIIWP